MLRILALVPLVALASCASQEPNLVAADDEQIQAGSPESPELTEILLSEPEESTLDPDGADQLLLDSNVVFGSYALSAGWTVKFHQGELCCVMPTEPVMVHGLPCDTRAATTCDGGGACGGIKISPLSIQCKLAEEIDLTGRFEGSFCPAGSMIDKYLEGHPKAGELNCWQRTPG